MVSDLHFTGGEAWSDLRTPVLPLIPNLKAFNVTMKKTAQKQAQPGHGMSGEKGNPDMGCPGECPDFGPWSLVPDSPLAELPAQVTETLLAWAEEGPRSRWLCVPLSGTHPLAVVRPRMRLPGFWFAVSPKSIDMLTKTDRVPVATRELVS